MSRLVDFEHLQTSQHVHVGGVELEVGLVGADVVAGGHDPLHHQTEPQSVQQPKVLQRGRYKFGFLVRFVGLSVGQV